MNLRLVAACLLGGLLMAACAPAAAVRVGRQIGASVYLPTSLPSGMRLSDVQQIGRHMAWLSYKGGQGKLSIFESPEPIAPPPGALRDKQGMWEATSLVGGQTMETALLGLRGAYVEVMAVGMTQEAFKGILGHWQKVGP